MRVVLQDLAEKGTAGREDDFVGAEAVGAAWAAAERHVEEVFILAQLLKCSADVCFEVVPP